MREENFACLESRSQLVGAQIEGQGAVHAGWITCYMGIGSLSVNLGLSHHKENFLGIYRSFSLVSRHCSKVLTRLALGPLQLVTDSNSPVQVTVSAVCTLGCLGLLWNQNQFSTLERISFVKIRKSLLLSKDVARWATVTKCWEQN